MKHYFLYLILASILVTFQETSILVAQNLPDVDEPEVVRAADKPRSTKTEPDIEQRTDQIIKLIARAVPYFLKNPLEVACRSFGHGAQWRIGNIFIMVFDASGNILVHGDDTDLIWKSKNINIVKGISGRPITEDMLLTGKQGGWVNYQWQGGFKTTYVKTVEKEGSVYILGAGFFPESREYATMQIVNNIIVSLERTGWEATLALIDNPYGPFVKGDIYAFIFDFEGNCMAHGENTGMNGQNLLEVKDDNGIFLVKELIKVAQSKEGIGWVDYTWKHESKRSYAQRYINPKTKIPYLVSAGYYPNTDQSDVRIFVERAIKHLQNVGAKAAFVDFSNPVGEFIRGGLFIEVYSMEGRIMASGDNPGFVNQDFLNRKDPDGKYVTRAILNQANKYGKGIVTVMDKNAYKVMYVEKVVVPDGVFVITSGYYPASKTQSVQSLVNKAAEALRQRDTIESLREFGNSNGEFWRGDVNLFVYTPLGSRLVAGAQTHLIWQNFYKERDQAGKPVIDNIIALALAGGGWARYQSRNATRRVFVRSVEKRNSVGKIETFILGSGYYL